jgi:hypothetical protein
VLRSRTQRAGAVCGSHSSSGHAALSDCPPTPLSPPACWPWTDTLRPRGYAPLVRGVVSLRLVFATCRDVVYSSLIA